jgi:hypothetical protein
MRRSTFQQLDSIRLIAKLAVLWIVLLILPFAERTLLGAKTYYFLYIGLALVFVLYGFTVRSVFAFLHHTGREPVYVWIAYLAWSVFYLQHSVSVRLRVRSSSARVRAIDRARPTPDRLPLL